MMKDMNVKIVDERTDEVAGRWRVLRRENEKCDGLVDLYILQGIVLRKDLFYIQGGP